MSGLYIHIPYCKQACHYCNFHFSTTLRTKDAMLDALIAELHLRQKELPDTPLSSVYLGGGTPSLLTANELERLFTHIHRLFELPATAEITLEANPDDLSPERLRELQQLPVNRLSIGVQSFSETDLRFMNRVHNAIEARACIEYAQDIGFDNLSIDLIYGAPTTSDTDWAHNVAIALEYDIPHLSCYALTVEPHTALHTFIQRGQAPPIDEEQAARQFLYLIDNLESVDYHHYEISNFAQPGWEAVHNSSYWGSKPYLGIGPAAHSFDGHRTRRWNVANNAAYIKGVREWADNPAAGPPAGLTEAEHLTDDQRYNEKVMTALRTSHGLNLEHLRQLGKQYVEHFLEQVQPFLDSNHLIRSQDTFQLSLEGKLLTDHITAELFR